MSTEPRHIRRRPPRSPRERLRFLSLLILLVLVYGVGVRVTRIDLTALKDYHLIVPLVRSLLNPDLIEPNVKEDSLLSPFVLLPNPVFGESYLALSRYEGRPGDEVVIEGFAFPANAPGVVEWKVEVPHGGPTLPLGEVRTDRNGYFRLVVRVPEEAGGVNRIQAKVDLDAPLPEQAQQTFLIVDRLPEEAWTVRVSPRVGAIGDLLVVEGEGLPPNQEVHLFWRNTIGDRSPFATVTTDGEGRFRVEKEVPIDARGDLQEIEVTVTVRTGGWHASRALRQTAEKIVETIFLALMATTMGVFLAIPLSFLGARNLMARTKVGTLIYYLTRTFLNITRSIEPLIMAIIAAVWVGIGPFAGVLALGFHSVAALGKLYSEQIENIDPGPVEAITATGANWVQVVRYAVIPQIVPPFLAFTIYRWDINVRMSTVIGFVGGGGIGFLLQQWINLLQYRQAGTAIWAIALVVWLMDYASAKVRERIL